MTDKDIIDGNGNDGNGNDGNGNDDFRSQLPEKYRDHSALQDIKSMEGLVDSFINAQSLVGKDKVPLPGKDATEEDYEAFFNKIGRPEKPEEYSFDPQKMELPEGFQVNEDIVNDLKKAMHKNGLTKRQAEGLLKDYHELVGGDYKKQSTDAKLKREEWRNKLREDFGGAYDERVSLANDAFKKFGGNELYESLKEVGLLNHPGIVKSFAMLGELTSEDNSDRGGSGGNRFTMTAEQAKQEIENLRIDQDFQKAYVDRAHPGHQGAVEKMQKLFKLAFPNK